MGPSQSCRSSPWNQGFRKGRVRKPRKRTCLLKGCRRRFTPKLPQSRYCSEECAKAARRWSVWKARKKYRESPKAKKQRGQQAKRNRGRKKAKKAAGDPGNPPSLAPTVGHHCKEVPEHSCDRPGCYVCFTLTARSPLQRFCSRDCRQALHRVLQRERRWHESRHSSFSSCGLSDRSLPSKRGGVPIQR